MRFTLSWLKEFLDTDATLDEISKTLTAIGLEVEEITNPAAKLAPFVVAHIMEAQPHPNADRLRVCSVDDGQSLRQIVCGAPNARAGIKVVMAPVGAVIPANDIVIKASAIRGVDSNGMLCSARELGLGDDADGIIELPAHYKVGASFVQESGMDDPVIEIAITPNRGDCLGVYGIARDLAAAGLGTLKPLKDPHIHSHFTSPLHVKIDNEQDCPLFIGRHFRNVKNGASPEWLQRRLKSIGLKPISALVDITNYICFTYGRPLHVYDANKLNGNLTVRAARQDEKLQALNGKEYTLPAGLTVIADNTQVQALGGVIGGALSGCDEQTTEVFLEVALFDPLQVAKAGRTLEILTDSRYRFERNVDPDFVYTGEKIATSMILELCGGEVSELVVAGSDSEPNWQRTIHFDFNKVRLLGGTPLSVAEATAILTKLGFEVAGTEVLVPSWRSDVEGEADLVEEILRIYGYDNVPSVPLPRPERPFAPSFTPTQRRVKQLQRLLAGRQLREVVTWSFMPSPFAAAFGGNDNALQLLNPISADLDRLRPSILPNLLATAARNHGRGAYDLGLFEVGPIFPDAGNQATAIAAIRTGNAVAKTHYTAARVVDAFDAKADALAMLGAAGIPVANVTVTTDAPNYYHPGRSGVLRLGKNALAYFGEIHPAILKRYDIETAVVGCELFVEALPPIKKRTTTARPKLAVSDLQAVKRDFAFIVANDQPADQLLRTIRAVDRQRITEVLLFDVYSGKGVEEGKKSLAVSVKLQPQDKTFTEEDIQAISQQIVGQVQKMCDGVLRS